MYWVIISVTFALAWAAGWILKSIWDGEDQ